MTLSVDLQNFLSTRGYGVWLVFVGGGGFLLVVVLWVFYIGMVRQMTIPRDF